MAPAAGCAASVAVYGPVDAAAAESDGVPNTDPRTGVVYRIRVVGRTNCQKKCERGQRYGERYLVAAVAVAASAAAPCCCSAATTAAVGAGIAAFAWGL